MLAAPWMAWVHQQAWQLHDNLRVAVSGSRLVCRLTIVDPAGPRLTTNFPACFPAQGPWVDFVEMVVLLLAGNASFMAGCVYLPLNIGRLMLMAIKRASTLLTQVRPAGQDTRLVRTRKALTQALLQCA